MVKRYVELDEDIIWMDSVGGIKHHPLDGVYTYGHGRGLLAFGRSRLSQFSILQDIKVFHLSFYSEPDDPVREAWADSIRSEILKRLQYRDWHWYLSIVGKVSDPNNQKGLISINEVVPQQIENENLGYTFINSDEIMGESKNRIVFEVNDQLLDKMVINYWGSSITNRSIQGYQLPAHRIDLIEEWNTLQRDEFLFRRVMDESFIVFYTYPAENRHFAFLTNKLSMQDMETRLDIPSLQRMADSYDY